MVSTANGELLAEFGGSINFAQGLDGGERLLICDGLGFRLWQGTQAIWKTKRLSWDGIRNIELALGSLKGEGWHYDETWHRFEVNLETGESVGGVYS